MVQSQDNFQQTVLVAESFSIADWHLIMQDLDDLQAGHARHAREKPIEKRHAMAQELLEHGHGKDHSGAYELLILLYSLSDEALDKIIVSLDEVS